MDTITAYYATQGVLGTTVLVLIGVIVWQQRRIDAKDKQIMELQDKRMGDSDKYSETYVAVAKEGVGAQKDTNAAIALLQRSVDGLAIAVQQLLNGK